jgi:hypothetical protein
MKKLFLILTTAFLLIATACSGAFLDPGMSDQQPGSGGFGGVTPFSGGKGGAAGSGPGSSIPLTVNKWTNGNIAEEQTIWYSFNVTKDVEYYVWLNAGIEFFGDRYGDGKKTGNLLVLPLYLNNPGEPAFYEIADPAWETPISFVATSTGTVYLTVSCILPGTFAVAYTRTYNRPK